MCGRPSTTIGFERLFNPLARLDRPAFLNVLTDGVPARPLNMTAIEATNRGLVDMPWAMLTEIPEVTEVDVDALERRDPDAMVLDVREPEEYAQGHVPGAVNLPQADLASRLDSVPRDHLLYTICYSGRRSLNAARFLKQTGYTDVLSVRGGTEAWRRAGKPLEGAESATGGRRIAESEWSHAGGAPVFSWDV